MIYLILDCIWKIRQSVFSLFYMQMEFVDNLFVLFLKPKKKYSSYAVLCIQKELRTHDQHATWSNVFKEMVKFFPEY